MTESNAVVSLEEVRARFLEAETRLEEASRAVGSIEAAAASLGTTRASLAEAGTGVANLAARFGEVADTLHANAEIFGRASDAIKLGDPAAIKRQIEELDEAFTAMQAVMGERLTELDNRLAAVQAATKAAEGRQAEALSTGLTAAETASSDRHAAVGKRLEELAASIAAADAQSRAADQRGLILGVVAIGGIIVVAVLQFLP